MSLKNQISSASLFYLWLWFSILFSGTAIYGCVAGNSAWLMTGAAILGLIIIGLLANCRDFMRHMRIRSM